MMNNLGDSPSWHAALGAWRSWLAAAGRPLTTIRLRMHQLRRFARAHADPWRVTTQQMADWLGGHDWSAETKRSHRAALIGFYRWGLLSGHLPTNPAERLPPIRPTAPAPRPAPRSVVDAGLSATDERVRLMVRLAVLQGLRRGEIARLRVDDLVEGFDGWLMRVHGKGDKVRTIPVHDQSLVRDVRRRPGPFVFPGNDGGHLSPAYVGKLISRALPDGWTAHTLRHRFATATYRGSRDMLAVQQLLGHSRPETTQRYVALSDDSLREAVRHAA